MTAKAKPVSPEDALDPKKALVPTVVKVNEARVTRGFWPKIQRTAARIPFADQALAAWYAARDPQTPLPAKGMIFAALAYFVMPADIVPDVLLGTGFLDDATVLGFALQAVQRHILPVHHERARHALGEQAAGEGSGEAA